MQPVYKGGPALGEGVGRADAPPGSVAFWRLGQTGGVVKGAGGSAVIAVAPYLTHATMEHDPATALVREIPPPLEPSGLAGGVTALAARHRDDHRGVAAPRAHADYLSRTYRAQMSHPMVPVERFIYVK